MKNLRKNLGYFIVLFFCLVPIIIWLTIMPVSYRFNNISSSLKSLGQISSLIGIVLFSFAFVLNTRLKIFEEYFGGMDKAYKAHHIFGASAFVFILFHPLFLASSYAIYSAEDAIKLLTPGGNWPITFGIISLWILEILIILTFFVKMKYQNWKFTHKFMGLAFIFAALHVFFISSDVSNSIILRFYILSIILLGLISFFYGSIFFNLVNKRYEYKVEMIRRISKDVTELTLSPKSRKLSHLPGQFVFLSFVDSNISKEAHPFTISSSPDEKNLRFTIKNLGDYTSKISKISEGSIALVEGPYGRFTNYFCNQKEQIWIAGGIGITPFLSMARSIKGSQKITLFYSVKNKEDAVFLSELKRISSKNKNFKVILHLSSKRGIIDSKLISEKVGRLDDKEIFICGPQSMNYSLRKQFIRKGVKKDKIHIEEFALK